MSEPTTLRRCEAIEIDGAGQAMCGKPAQRWDAPNGKSYVVCAEHREAFSAVAVTTCP